MESSSVSQTAESYNRLAEVYETRWFGYLEETHQAFLNELIINPGHRLLDLSCGTGLLAKKIIARGDAFGELILNDVADKLQAQAKRRFSERSDLRFTSHSVDNLPFAEQSFDQIFCLSAFHNYPHQARVLHDCHHLLKPGGRLLILDWNRSGLFRLVNWFIKHNGREKINTRSLTEIRTMLRKNDFQINFEKAWRYTYWNFYFVIGRKG